MMAEFNNDTLFPVILASTVHDIKNSLGTLLGLIQQLALKQSSDQLDEIRQLGFEANRINHSLMQLLVMYKIGHQKFDLQVEEHAVIDVINEARAQQNSLLQMSNLHVQVECSEDLLCYYDYQYISNALGTILNNAQRYTQQSILISASESEGYIKFCIEDDGQGYPAHLLNADLGNPVDLNWVNGNTGLGLYFVAAIAGFHKNREKTGFVKIDNQSRIGGARFCLYLP
jgi:K+-sensing histidine kinase KdpD